MARINDSSPSTSSSSMTSISMSNCLTPCGTVMALLFRSNCWSKLLSPVLNSIVSFRRVSEMSAPERFSLLSLIKMSFCSRSRTFLNITEYFKYGFSFLLMSEPLVSAPLAPSKERISAASASSIASSPAPPISLKPTPSSWLWDCW